MTQRRQVYEQMLCSVVDTVVGDGRHSRGEGVLCYNLMVVILRVRGTASSVVLSVVQCCDGVGGKQRDRFLFKSMCLLYRN